MKWTYSHVNLSFAIAPERRPVNLRIALSP